jgi:4-hydroxy-2-oxoheptanedioate aldolase
LNTVEDAEKIVKAAKFPPLGVRGFGSPFSQGAFSTTMTSGEYLVQANSALLTIVQIETADALKNVDGIAAVPGVDVLFVGPFDLGNALGHPITGPTMHPELEAAIAKILAAAHKAGKKAGIYTPSGDQARKMAGVGFDMITVTADAIALAVFLGSEVAKAKGGVSTEKMTGPYGK